MLVEATQRGFYLWMRMPGDRFVIPTDAEGKTPLFSKEWMTEVIVPPPPPPPTPAEKLAAAKATLDTAIAAFQEAEKEAGAG